MKYFKKIIIMKFQTYIKAFNLLIDDDWIIYYNKWLESFTNLNSAKLYLNEQ